MDSLLRLLLGIMLALSIVFTWAGQLSAEIVRGEVKYAAVEAGLLTLQTNDSRLLLISWDNKTRFSNLGGPAEIRPNDYLLVDYSLQGEQLLAATIAVPENILPPGIQAASFAVIDRSFAGDSGAPAMTLVDIRPALKYDAGHIPGASSIPLARIAKRTTGLLPDDKNAAIVFYDDGAEVDAVVKAAGLTVNNGYKKVMILKEGVRGWVNSGRFLAASATFIRKSKPILIDLRSADTVHQGHLEGAVNYPLAALAQMNGNFLPDRRIPVVIYGESDRDALAGAAIFRKWGYKNVTFFQGGAAQWQNGAEALEMGPAAASIAAAADNHKGGMLPPDDFEKAVTSAQTVQLVDVRSDAEYRSGHFQTGVHIPLQDIARRHKELAREKIQAVFAADTDRAEMAYDFLKSKGYRVVFLGGSVFFDKDGKYTVK